MSDDKITLEHLEDAITPAPYHEITRRAIDLIFSTYGMAVKTSKELSHEAIYVSDLLTPIYNEIINEFGIVKLERFKKSLSRSVTCMVAAKKMSLPGQVEHVYYSCKNKGCPICAPYKAKERTLYPDVMVRIAVSRDLEEAGRFTQELNQFFQASGWDWMTVNMTPGHDGRNIIRIGNLRQHDLSPLVDDNEVKQVMSDFDELFPEFEPVTKTSDEASLEINYMTQGGVAISSVEIYTCRLEDRQAREFGTKRGFEFDFETESIVHYTLEQKKKKEMEEKGIIETYNVPLIVDVGATYEEIYYAIVWAARSVTNDPEKTRFILPAESIDAFKHQNVTFIQAINKHLAARGYDAPEVYGAAYITKDQIDYAMATYACKDMYPKENLMDIEFTDDMLYQPGKSYGLKSRHEALTHTWYYQLQQQILAARNIEEFAAELALKIHSKPPPE